MFTHKTPWVILLILWMMGSTWWHVCKIKQLCGNDAQPVAVSADSTLDITPVKTPGFTIADEDYFRLNFPGNFSFAKSGANANMNSLGGSLGSMITYIKVSPNRTLEIIGYYSKGEANTTTFPNLGLARAEGIKQYLIQQGISATSLTTTGVERDIPFTAKGDSLVGGLDFVFTGTADAPATDSVTAPTPVTIAEPTTEKELAASEKFTSVFKPIDLYFPLSVANYIKTDETKKFFEEATKYLAEHKDKKLLLTGHTDSSGPDEVNMRLSLDRANQVKSKLRKSGIEADQIAVKAKGETEPKADNSTISGRKANRRVTVVVE
ncbi:OmpA family protein [Spirosoma pollinicola]|uniref:Flagellar motor protein MotB n=1 Tax=Spirosoma pollinicola TaxID=2057025 RepID=A0A2K8YZ07_9BACT|nr:OmpA family protein [Spirosoma pollinicola]AUD02845.1 flagellar motor protein MotB [Spirosoma pollinicola]